jgi:hypothetical protein
MIHSALEPFEDAPALAVPLREPLLEADLPPPAPLSEELPLPAPAAESTSITSVPPFSTAFFCFFFEGPAGPEVPSAASLLPLLLLAFSSDNPFPAPDPPAALESVDDPPAPAPSAPPSESSVKSAALRSASCNRKSLQTLAMSGAMERLNAAPPAALPALHQSFSIRKSTSIDKYNSNAKLGSRARVCHSSTRRLQPAASACPASSPPAHFAKQTPSHRASFHIRWQAAVISRARAQVYDHTRLRPRAAQSRGRLNMS